MFRPRSGMAKVLYQKILTDQKIQAMDKSKWYQIDEQRMKDLSQDIGSKFEQFEMDESTQLFLDSCVENSDNTFWQMWLTLASSILSWFLTNTSVNGLLGRGSMQVFSSDQFEQLIDYQHSNNTLGNLLDIGAGDGSTTDRMADCFSNVYATEMSTTMRWTLQKKGYTVLDVSEWSNQEVKFDVISCLNVLDRCEKPLTLINQIKSSLKPGGVAVLAFVIPFKPYVEFGQHKTTEPTETLMIEDKTFEGEVRNFVENVLTPNGWDVVKWTKLPYLCEGDINQAFYWLDDVVFVVRPKIEQCLKSENACPRSPF
ncbi:Methyltransferase-like protein 9, partial [Orchesella cincta]